MYQLTEYSLSDLRIIQAVIEDSIFELEAIIKQTERYLSGDIHDTLIMKYSRRVSVLKEHNVHLLTAIQIVKDRETVNSN